MGGASWREASWREGGGKPLPDGTMGEIWDSRLSYIVLREFVFALSPGPSPKERGDEDARYTRVRSVENWDGAGLMLVGSEHGRAGEHQPEANAFSRKIR